MSHINWCDALVCREKRRITHEMHPFRRSVADSQRVRNIVPQLQLLPSVTQEVGELVMNSAVRARTVANLGRWKLMQS